MYKFLLLSLIVAQTIVGSSIRELVRQKFCLSQRTLKNFDAAEDKERFIQLYKQKHLHHQEMLIESQGLCCWIGIGLCCIGGSMCLHANDVVNLEATRCINPHSSYFDIIRTTCIGGTTCLACPMTELVCILNNIPGNPLLTGSYDECTCWQKTHTEMLSRLKKGKK